MVASDSSYPFSPLPATNGGSSSNTFCIPSVIVVLFNQARHPQGLYSAVETGITFFSLPSFIFTFLPPSFAKPGTGAGAGGGSVALSIATGSMVADRRNSGTIYKMTLIDRLRLRAGENFLETRSTSQRVPLPPQTKISERDATRKIRPLDCARRGEQAFDQRDRLGRLANECINQRQIGRPVGTMKCVVAFRL